MAALISKRALRDGSVILLLAVVPAVLNFWLHPQRAAFTLQEPTVNEVELDDVIRWKPAPLWIDARATSAYDREHIPGAILLNEDRWNELLPTFLVAWQPRIRVVVYCDSEQCNASQAVVLRLKRELKISEVFVLKGGWSTWKNAHP